MNPIQGPFYVSGGTLSADSPSYVEREADRDLHRHLLEGEFCYVLTSRQMGKSSLMVRTANRLRESKMHVVVLDLTAIGQNLAPEQWYDGLLAGLGRQVRLEDELEDHWKSHFNLGPVQRFFSAIRDVVLRRRSGPLMIFVDELDMVRSLPFSTDEFFAAIRECYTSRAQDAEYERINFCLLGVATPSDLIRDTRITPFNIARRIELNDFSIEEAAPLARGLEKAGFPSGTARAILERVFYWTHGHPYLTQRLCLAVVEAKPAGGGGRAQLVDKLCEDLFLSRRAREQDDNLLFVRERLLRSEVDRAALLDLYGRVWKGKRIPFDETNPSLSILRLAGITRLGEGSLKVRNRIYEQVFDKEWIRANMPDAELQRQRAAFRRGVFRTAALATLIVGALASLAFYGIRQARLARKNESESLRRLVQWNVNGGVRLLDEGDLTGSLPWFAKALSMSGNDAAHESLHRFRLAAVLQQCPRVMQILFQPGPLNSVEFSPDGRTVLTASLMGIAQLWDATTGAPVIPPFKPSGTTARFSPNGRLVVNCGAETAQVWDASTGNPVGQPLKHDLFLISAEFSRDSLRIVTASADGTARIWNALTGESISPPLRHHVYPTHAGFSPDGRFVLTASWDNTAQIWDAVTGEKRSPPMEHKGGVHDADFSPEGFRVVTASADATARVWEAATGRPLAGPLWHNGEVTSARFSPDGRRVATCSKDGTARVWDAVTGEPITPALPHGDEVDSIQFSADGRFVLTASKDRTARVWEAASGKAATPPLRNSAEVKSAAFSPEGARVITGCADGTTRVWKLGTGQKFTASLRSGAKVNHAEFSPDNRKILTASGDGVALLWDARTTEPLTPPMRHGGEVLHAAFSPDGQRVATGGGDGSARVWDAASGRAATPELTHGSSVRQVVFSPHGDRVATASWDGTVRIWDARTGQPITQALQHKSEVECVRFSSDGKLVATSGREDAVRVWRADTGEEVAALGHAFHVTSVCFSRDGRRVLTACKDKLARVLDLETGRQVGDGMAHNGPVLYAEFSPDERRIVTASADSTARVWDAATGKPIAPPLQHRASVLHAAFRRGGEEVVTASQDFTARVWDAATGQPLTPLLRHQGPVHHAEFSPDGRSLVTASQDQMARLWHLPADDRPEEELERLARLLSGYQFDNTGSLVPVHHANAAVDLTALRAKYPQEFGFTEEEKLAWHARMAADSEQTKDWFAARFHLERLREARPDDGLLRARHESGEAQLELAKGLGERFGSGAGVPPRNPAASRDLIDLTDHYTAALTESWLPGFPNNNLAALPTGVQILGGVPFDLRGLIQLAGRTLTGPRYPEHRKGIRYGGKGRRLNFLHASALAFATDAEGPIGHYVIHYSDGREQPVPIVYRRDVYHWYSSEEARNGVIAWTGQNPPTAARGLFIRLFKSTWENPRPEENIETIDFVSTKTGAAPFLVAITAER